MSTGRIPPNDKVAESSVLGSVLLSNKVLDEVQSLINADDFYVRANSCVWDGILRMRNEQPGVTIDLRSLTAFLKGAGLLQDCGGPGYISSLTSVLPVTGNAVYYAKIVKNCSLKRKMLELSVQVSESVFDESEDVKTSIDRIDQSLTALSMNVTTNAYTPSKSYLFNLIDDIHERMDNKKAIGVCSGFKTLDKYIGAFKPGELSIIGARPSVGKTALALSIAHNIAFKGSETEKVGFFSLEMSGQALMERLLSREGSIDANILRNGMVSKETEAKIITCVENMYNRAGNLLIQDTPNIKLLEIKSQSRRMVKYDDVKIIFIDYIGLIELENAYQKPRHEQISEISRALKSLARELKIPIVCLSQVNREAGKDRQPILADLRESGSIEQDADLVILLDDPTGRLDENNKVKKYDIEEETENNKTIKVIIAKQRNGRTGGFEMCFRSNYVSFEDLEKNLD